MNGDGTLTLAPIHAQCAEELTGSGGKMACPDRVRYGE